MVGRKRETEHQPEMAEVTVEEAMKKLFQPVVIRGEEKETSPKAGKEVAADIAAAAEQVLNQKTTFGMI